MNSFQSGNQLQPNFFEAELTENKTTLYTAEYSVDLFKESIDRKDEYFYYRSGSTLYALPENKNLQCPYGFKEKDIVATDEPYVFSKLVEILFKSFFEFNKRKVFKKRYSSLLFFTIESEEPFQVGEIKLVPVCYFSSHHFFRDNRIVFVVTLAKEYKPRLTQSPETYNKIGVDIRDWDLKGDRILASYANIKKYLDRTNQQSKYDNAVARLRNKENELKFIEKTFSYINKNIDEINTKAIAFKSLSLLSIPNTNFEIISIHKPTLFYYNNNTTSGYIHTAIEQLRPLSYDLFNNREITICAFIPSSDAKQCERIITNIHSQLVQIFHLFHVKIVKYYVGSDHNEHLKIISKFSNKQFDLALTFLYKKDKKQRKSESTYNRLKAKLISKQIPSQSLLVENTRDNNIFTLRNLALNIYSKLGGTPWSIEKEGLDTDEFIIGVGSSIDEDGSRNIGFASVFDHFGSYIVGSCSPLCKIDEYSENLRQYLSSILSELIDSRGIAKNSKIRLIFHLYKNASKRYEISAINKCLEEFSDYQIEFAILNVSFNHPFKLYKNRTDQLDRGCFIKLTEFQALLCMGGKGSQPLQIQLDYRSTYKDLFELSKQVLYFSHLSHCSFMPSKKPVTTIYPQRLVQLTSNLLKINHWDTDMLHGMKDKLWFI